MVCHGIESCHCASQSHFHRNQINLAQFEWKMLLAEKIVSNDRDTRHSDDTHAHIDEHVECARVYVCVHAFSLEICRKRIHIGFRRTEAHDFADERMTRDNFGHACKSTRKFKTSVMAPSFVHLLAGSFKSVDLFIRPSARPPPLSSGRYRYVCGTSNFS